MADNYLEYAREDYERRKAEWMKRRRALPTSPKGRKALIENPEDEAL